MKDERNVFERRPCDGFGPSLSALPPFAECAKDGAPTVFLASARAKVWATHPVWWPLLTWVDYAVRRCARTVSRCRSAALARWKSVKDTLVLRSCTPPFGGGSGSERLSRNARTPTTAKYA